MSNTLKRKTAMVLHQIEESLGNFVLKNGEVDYLNPEILSGIHRRESDKGKSFDTKSIKDIVEATYLDELFRFALEITKDSTLQESVTYIYKLFHDLDIYEVRNTVSHPNRPFWDCYWYRVAAIASDPVNDILGFEQVKHTLVSAEKGMIEDPPEEWVNKIIWQIPNNLPTQFDHGVTGLIGRTKEIQELKKLIATPRVNTIAVVAPGGTGKTALALDLLDNIVSTPSFSQFIDSVIFVSMKTEKLTANGLVPLDAIETIAQLQDSIASSLAEVFDEEIADFNVALANYSSRKVFLCLDNLETLLRDDPTCFEEFNLSLPSAWRVLVTSRISVSNASILSIEVLKEKSANHLARVYVTKRGGTPLSEDLYSNLTKSCHYNPLAIRLTLDLILTGKDIPESLNVANKEIAEFSYNNLIESLSENAINILETIFVEDTSTRISLCDLLSLSLDEVSAGVSELSKTSLIIRQSSTQGETYFLSDSIRDLLVISPRNIDARNKVQELLSRRRILSKEIDLIQHAKELPTWHTEYIPKDTPENLKIIIKEANEKLKKVRKNTDIAVMLYRKFTDNRFLYNNNAIFFRTFARILEALKDLNGAERAYKKSIELDPDNACTKYLLARFYHNWNKYDESLSIYQELISAGLTCEENSNEEFGTTIYNGYFLALLYSGRHDLVLDSTKNWKKSKKYRGTLGTYRASAWKRKMENIVESNPEEAIHCLISSIRILNDVFTNDGYLTHACMQAIKIYEEIEFCLSRVGYVEKFQNEGLELLRFIENHYFDTVKNSKNLNEKTIERLSKLHIKDNPFKYSKWKDLATFSESYNDLDNLEDADTNYVKVILSNRPKDSAKFMFAKDAAYNTYFLHFDQLMDGNWQMWCRLSIGTSLYILPSQETVDEGKAKPVSQIYLEL